MLTILVLLLAPLMPWLARASGGGAGATKVYSGLPEILFGAVIGVGALLVWGYWLALIVGALIGWLAMELGHTRVLGMRGVAMDSTKEPSTIEKAGPQWLWEKVFKRNIHSPAYSWFIMGIKGFLIASPLGPVAFLVALLWPAAYWYGYRFCNVDDGTTEWLAGSAMTLALTFTVAALWGHH